MPLVAVGIVILRLQIIRRRITETERIPLIVSIGIIGRYLIVSLELKLVRQLLIHAGGEAPEQGFRRGFDSGQRANSVLAVGPDPSGKR